MNEITPHPLPGMDYGPPVHPEPSILKTAHIRCLFCRAEGTALVMNEERTNPIDWPALLYYRLFMPDYYRQIRPNLVSYGAEYVVCPHCGRRNPFRKEGEAEELELKCSFCGSHGKAPLVFRAVVPSGARFRLGALRVLSKARYEAALNAATKFNEDAICPSCRKPNEVYRIEVGSFAGGTDVSTGRTALFVAELLGRLFFGGLFRR